MAPSCDHETLHCVHMRTWPRKLDPPEGWTSRRLSIECRVHEENEKLIWGRIDEHQPEIFSENETEVDSEEEENYLNNLPSPKHRKSCLWTSEYQARREARKRLWSPPITPSRPWMPSYSLQPSQRAPSPAVHRRRTTHHPASQNDAPQVSQELQLRLYPTVQHNRVRKTRTPTKLHRPTTRSMKPSRLLALHNRKGYLEVWSAASLPRSTTFQEYLDLED